MTEPLSHHKLIDGVDRNTTHPETFEIPSEEERDAVRNGDTVKVGFEVIDFDLGEDIGERMWVSVTFANGNTLVGWIDNVPISQNLQLKQEIQFERRHILNIYDGPE